MSQGHQKPVGASGTFALGLGGASSGFVPIEFGHDKRAIEDYIFETALLNGGSEFYKLRPESSSTSGLLVPRHNDENDIDYTISTVDGPQHIDLMEVAPISTGSYETESGTYIVGELADWVWRAINAKSVKYAGISRTSTVHLLLYSTDFKFVLVKSVIDLLSLEASRQNHSFTTISYFCPSDQTHGTFSPVYPLTTAAIEQSEESAVRRRQLATADLRMHVQPDGSASKAPLLQDTSGQHGLISFVAFEVPGPASHDQGE